MFVAISIARSQAMIADSCAMVIDSLTYLFNSWAERIKNKSLQRDDGDLSESEKELLRLERTRQRLLLEIAPPFCSVLTLIVLTISVSKEAADTLSGGNDIELNEEAASGEEDPNVAIMFFFSGLNLALDILNVTCFARAKHAFGFAVIDEDRHRYMLAYDGSLHNVYADSLRTPSEINLKGFDEEEDVIDTTQTQNYSSIAEEREEASLQINQDRNGFQEVNLNMCSAYTVSAFKRILFRSNQNALTLSLQFVKHVFADTLRSTAVLLAAGISYTFSIGAPAMVDAVAALAVSLIILMSLGPLLRGIYHAWTQLRWLSEMRDQMKCSQGGGN